MLLHRFFFLSRTHAGEAKIDAPLCSRSSSPLSLSFALITFAKNERRRPKWCCWPK